jgi:hypothetical protein
MVYWYGWNDMIERTRASELAGYKEGVTYSHVKLSNSHVVQLEDPAMLGKLTQLLALPEKVTKAASLTTTENAGAGQSSEKAKEGSTAVTWIDLFVAVPSLAQDIWTMAKRCVCNSSRVGREACLGDGDASLPRLPMQSALPKCCSLTTRLLCVYYCCSPRFRTTCSCSTQVRLQLRPT